jgi:hypothetical protein
MAEREGFEPSVFYCISISYEGIVSKSYLSAISETYHRKARKPLRVVSGPNATTLAEWVNALLRNAQHATLDR